MALTITKDDVLTRFSELAVEPELNNATWADLLDQADEEIPVTSWLNQDSADRAAKYLVAHLALTEKLRQTKGLSAIAQTGALQSVTVGPVTTQFTPRPANPNSTIDDQTLGLTEYGREYLRLRKRFCRGRR